jgi:hypothetical protein
MKTWARENAPSCGMSDHEQFVDYWTSVPGAKGRKLDWAATWRNWMRKAHQDRGGRQRPVRAPAQRTSTTDKVQGWLALANQAPDNGAAPALEEGSTWHE